MNEQDRRTPDVVTTLFEILLGRLLDLALVFGLVAAGLKAMFDMAMGAWLTGLLFAILAGVLWIGYQKRIAHLLRKAMAELD